MKFNNAMGLNLRLNKRQQRVTPPITPAPTKTLLLTKHRQIMYTDKILQNVNESVTYVCKKK